MDAIGSIYRTTASGSVHGCNPTAKAESERKVADGDKQYAEHAQSGTRRVQSEVALWSGILVFGTWGFSKGQSVHSPVIVDESGWRFQSEIAGDAENFPDK